MGKYKLFEQEPVIINVGVRPFAQGVLEQGAKAVHVVWQPPADKELARRLARMDAGDLGEKVAAANAEAARRMLAAEAHFVGLERALKAVPGMEENLILHSGPPMAWEELLPVQQQGILGGALHAGLAKTKEEALGMIQSGEIRIGSANDYFCVGAGVGIITHNMVVNICEDRATGLRGYCIPFEGRSGLGVWGVYNQEVEETLREIEEVFAPAIDEVLRKSGGVNVYSILARGLQMGDESHTRQTACGLMLSAQLVPMLLDSGLDRKTVKRCADMLLATERWFHPLGMAASMAAIRSIKGLEYCTVATTICQNGVATGLKVAALGERWFYAPAPAYVGQYFSTRWGPEDAACYIGDSTVTEVMGLGGFAAAASPAVQRLRGGGWREAVQQSLEMRGICVTTNHNLPIPLLDFTGPGLGIDIRKVVETGVTPFCHGGIIGKEGGQIGAGGARFPLAYFQEAMHAFLDQYGAAADNHGR